MKKGDDVTDRIGRGRFENRILEQGLPRLKTKGFRQALLFIFFSILSVIKKSLGKQVVLLARERFEDLDKLTL